MLAAEEKKGYEVTSEACFPSTTGPIARLRSPSWQLDFFLIFNSLSSSSFCPLTQETLALPRQGDKEVEGPSLPLQISCNCRVIKGRETESGGREEEWTDTMGRIEQPEKWLMWAATLWFADSYQRGQPFAHYSRLRAAEDQWLRSHNHHQPWPLW